MRAALEVVKRAIKGAGDLVAEAEAELAATKASAEAARAEAQRLGAAWLAAASQEAAEQIARQRGKLLRVAERYEQQLGALEGKLAAARATKQQAGIARHCAIMRQLYPKLRHAVETAAAVQAEVIGAREAAVAELGEHAVTLQIPRVAYAGFLLGDLVGLWAAEQDRVWAPRPAPVAVQPPAPPKPPAAKSRPMVEISGAAPVRVARQPRRDPAPETDAERRIVALSAGVELGDGKPALAIGEVA